MNGLRFIDFMLLGRLLRRFGLRLVDGGNDFQQGHSARHAQQRRSGKQAMHHFKAVQGVSTLACSRVGNHIAQQPSPPPYIQQAVFVAAAVVNQGQAAVPDFFHGLKRAE